MTVTSREARISIARWNSRYNFLLLTIATFAVYLATLTHQYTGFSLTMSKDIETGPLAALLRPHEMLNLPLGWMFYHLWQLFGWTGKALLPLQVYNALAGALAVGLMYAIAARITRSPWTALLVALGFAVSSGVWLFSLQAEFVTPPLAESLLVLWWWSRMQPGAAERPGHIVAFGLATALCIVTYITSIFLVPIFLVSYLFAGPQVWRLRWRQAVLYLLVVGAATLLVYACLWFFVQGVRDPRTLLSGQLYGGQGAGLLYGRFGLHNFTDGDYGFLKTLAGFPGIGLEGRAALYLTQTSRLGRWLFRLYFGLAILIVCLLAAFVIQYRRYLWRTHRPLILLLASWTLLYAAFATYWVPKDQQFWTPVLVPLWLVAGLLLVVPDAYRRPLFFSAWARRLDPSAWGYGLVLGTVVLLALANGVGTVLVERLPQRNLVYGIALSVGEHTTHGDLILMSGADALSDYIPYFTDDATIVVLQRILDEPNQDVQHAWQSIDRDIARAQSAGKRVFLVELASDQDVSWDDLEAVGLRQADFARFKTQPGWPSAGADIREIVP